MALPPSSPSLSWAEARALGEGIAGGESLGEQLAGLYARCFLAREEASAAATTPETPWAGRFSAPPEHFEIPIRPLEDLEYFLRSLLASLDNPDPAQLPPLFEGLDCLADPFLSPEIQAALAPDWLAGLACLGNPAIGQDCTQGP